MRRIFDDYAYGDGPRSGCWWDETCEIPARPSLEGTHRVDVAIVGAGFTGISAARRLAEAGVSVIVLDMHAIGWGASGRNGGFCCLGGGIGSDRELDAAFGKDARLEFRRAEKAAVAHVGQVIEELRLDVDRHSDGETELAHRPKDMADLRARARSVRDNYGVDAEVIARDALADLGMNGDAFFGAVTVPIGFGLNPRKYIAGLARAAETAGARLFERSVVTSVKRSGAHWVLTSAAGTVEAEQVIIATNGYSSEDVPAWMAGRYMPLQSTILVTRPLSSKELRTQGWWSDQMSYDSRNLLHYFRLMPDRRFLFGMRGAVLTGAAAEARARASTRAHFERMFPAWAQVESRHSWSGLVSLARRKVPFVGEIPGQAGLWAAMCYHGNGVAMGSYAGRMLADLVMDRQSPDCPSVMREPLARFPLGRARRLLMPPLYARLLAADW